MLDFIENGNVLEIRVTNKEEFKTLLKEMGRQKLSPYQMFERILDEGLEENYQYETYQRVMPEQVGALTDSILIAKNAEIADDGEIISTEWIAWYPDYQIRSELAVLIKNNVINFTIERN